MDKKPSSLSLVKNVQTGRHAHPAEVLTASGFIGCGEASRDLSERYKEDVRSFVAAK
jgi:hypothetical protein